MDLSQFDMSRLLQVNQDFVIETSNLNTIIESCSNASKDSAMIGIIGEAGYGKTKSLEYYLSKDKNAYYVVVEPNMSAKELYVELLRVMGHESTYFKGSNLSSLIRSTAFHLNQSKNKNLLIFDEAGKFNPQRLLYLHVLRDKTKNSTGIVLAGPPYFRSNLEDWKMKGKQGITELLSRIDEWIDLEIPSLKEKRAICIEKGIIGNELIHDICTKHVDFRELNKRVRKYRLAVEKYILNTTNNQSSIQKVQTEKKNQDSSTINRKTIKADKSINGGKICRIDSSF